MCIFVVKPESAVGTPSTKILVIACMCIMCVTLTTLDSPLYSHPYCSL